MADNDDKPPCVMCPAPGHLLCGQCKEVRFCSVECQETAWYSHRLLCKKFLDFRERPSDGMYRIIYFPSDASESSRPEFRWLSLDGKGIGEHAGLNELMDGQLHSPMDVKSKHPFLARTLTRPLCVAYDDDFMRNYPGEHNVNAALVHATAGQQSYLMGGPIVVYSGSFRGGSIPRDVNMLDYHHVCAWFIDNYNNTEANKRRKGPKVQGVMISCQGERRLTGKTSKAVTVSRLHPVWYAGSLSPISKRIGLPLLVIPYQKERNEWDSPDDRVNASTFTQVGIDPNSNHDFETSNLGNFGWAPKRWQHGKGNVLFVPENRSKSLDPDTVEAFVDFCHWHITQFFQWESELRDQVPEAQQKNLTNRVLEEITKRKWEVYLQDWKTYKQQGIKDDEKVNMRIDGKVSMGFDAETADRLCLHLLSNEHCARYLA